jgi:AcrR family transcriptional regulator
LSHLTPTVRPAEAPRRTRRDPRADRTQQRILAGARRLFADLGYERTTVRAIAAEAGIDPAMIMRYYGSKDGLFAAATEFDLRLADIAAGPIEDLGQRLVRHFLDRWESPSADEQFSLLLRAAISDAESARRLHSIFEAQLTPALADVATPKRLRDCAALVAAQMVGLGCMRYVLRVPNVAALSRRAIVEQVGAAIQGYVDFGRGL